MHDTLLLLIKVTRRCNLRCTYCTEWRSKSPNMSREVAHRLVEVALREDRRRYVQFQWNGGEPTLVPIEFYEDVLLKQKRELLAGQSVVNIMQTNATRIDANWIEFFKRSQFGVSVSLDGPQILHDRTRLRVNGEGSFDLVNRGIDRLREANIEFGALMVLSEEMLRLGPANLWQFLQKAGLPIVNLLPARPPNHSGATEVVNPEHVEVDRYTAFLAELFDLWFKSDGSIKILFFDSLVRRILGGQSQTCLVSGGCIGAIWGVEPDGDAMHCVLYQGDAEYSFGNLVTQSIEDLVASPKFGAAISAEAERNRQLRGSCDQYGICNGGCPHENYLDGWRASSEIPTLCCGYGPMIRHIRQRIDESDRPPVVGSPVRLDVARRSASS